MANSRPNAEPKAGEAITQRHQAEGAANRSQQTFTELVERAPFGIYVVDSQFRIAQMNTGSQAGAFRNVRPVIGRDFAEAMRILWPEPVAAGIIAAFRHTLESGEPYYSPRFLNPRHDVERVEAYEWELHRITLPDGQYGVVCYYFDSTRLRQAEETLSQSETAARRERDLLQAVMNGAQNSHLVYLDRDFNFLRVNETYARTCGYRPEEMIGKNHFALYPNAENEAIFARVRDTGDPIEFHDRPFEFPDQPERGVTYWDWTLSPVKDAAGKVEGLVFALHETTERKRAEEALQASNAELARFNQAMVGRELRMIDLKQEVNALCAQLAQPPRYSVQAEATAPQPKS
jgi:PAS domain S-box-containing protein